MTLAELREQLQEDLRCILDDYGSHLVDTVCQAIVDRINQYQEEQLGGTIMKTYRVEIPETHICHYRVKAASEDKAKQAVSEGEGEELSSEFDHVSNQETWIVEEEQS